MHMIRHNAPGVQIVTVAIKIIQCIVHNVGHLGSGKPIWTVAGMKLGIYALAVFFRGYGTGFKLSLDTGQIFRGQAAGQTECDMLEAARLIKMRRMAGPSSVESLWIFVLREVVRGRVIVRWTILVHGDSFFGGRLDWLHFSIAWGSGILPENRVRITNCVYSIISGFG